VKGTFYRAGQGLESYLLTFGLFTHNNPE